MASEEKILRIPYRSLAGRLSPLIAVQVFHGQAQLIDHAYVDSGAFYSVFDMQIAERLGLDFQRGKRGEIVSLEGRRMPLFLFPVGLRVGDLRINAEIGFSPNLRIGFNILGRYSIFNQLEFCFNDRENELTISPI